MGDAICLVDANNYYASCEKLFDRSLHNRSVIVLSNNDGCVIARSAEARRLGINMGTPLFKIESFLEEMDVAVFSSNYELYGDVANRLHENLYNFTPEVEIYSIDEAFLGLSSLELAKTNKSFDYLGREIKEKIEKWTGIGVSLGIAETKVLAKVANKLAKSSEKARGVLNLYKSPHQQIALERTPVSELWGVGRATTAKLHENEIFTAWDFRETNVRWIRKALTVVGARIWTELRGMQAFSLELNPPPRRSITCSRTFGQAVASEADLREAVSVFLHRAAEKMRRHNLAANSVTVFVSTDRFNPYPAYYSNSATYASAYLTDANFELQRWAFDCLRQIYRSGYSYRKAGVFLNGLTPADKLTQRMFDDERWERFRNVQRAADEINRRFGRDTVRLGIVSREARWQMRQTRRSPRYTTRLDEIMTVK